MFRRPVDPPSRGRSGCQSRRVACTGETSLLAGVLAPEVDDLSAEEPHLRALVDLDDPAGLAIDLAGVLRARRRARQAGGTSSIQPPRCEHVVRVEVVRLPQRSRVGRDREAPDGDTVARDPRREHERRARADDEQRGEPVVGEAEANHEPESEHEWKEDEPRVAEDRDADDGAERGSQPERSASFGGESATRTIAAARSWSSISRLRWTSCQTRYGCSVARSAPPRRSRSRRSRVPIAIDDERRERRDRRSAPLPTASHDRSNPVDRDEEEAVERLRVRGRDARDEAERAAVEERQSRSRRSCPCTRRGFSRSYRAPQARSPAASASTRSG